MPISWLKPDQASSNIPDLITQFLEQHRGDKYTVSELIDKAGIMTKYLPKTFSSYEGLTGQVQKELNRLVERNKIKYEVNGKIIRYFISMQ